MTEAPPPVEIDARGLECPAPTGLAVETMRSAREAGSRESVVIRLDDAICAADIPYHANALGYDAESTRAAGPEWTITLRPRGVAGED